MTRFVKNYAYDDKKGNTLTIKTRDELEHNLLANWVSLDLVKARELLETTDAKLHAKRHAKDVLHYANKFFLTDKTGIAAKDLATMMTVITKTWTGLSGDVTIKAGKGIDSDGKQLYGYVKRKSGSHSNKPYHTEEADLGTSKMHTWGAIHVDESALLGGRMGVVTLIHEATHKYAGTVDYCYLANDDQAPRGAFDDKTRALINADSYAWFVLKVGRSMSLTDWFLYH